MRKTLPGEKPSALPMVSDPSTPVTPLFGSPSSR